MAPAFKARVWERAQVTGTGALQLAGVAQAGPYQNFKSAVPNGATISYCVVDLIASTWEVGTGVFTLNATTPSVLTRSPTESSNGGNLVNFGGNTCEITLDIISPVTSSSGAGSSGNLPALDATGKLDISFSPIFYETNISGSAICDEYGGVISISDINGGVLYSTSSVFQAAGITYQRYASFPYEHLVVDEYGGMISFLDHNQNLFLLGLTSVVQAELGGITFQRVSPFAYQYLVIDEYGGIVSFTDQNTNVYIAGLAESASSSSFQTISINAQIVVDSYGGLISQTYASPAYFSPDEITARDNAAMVSSQQVKGQTNTTAQRASAQLNLYVKNGQSEALGCDANVPITTNQPLDVLMIGDSVRPANFDNSNLNEFIPLGSSSFNPAISTYQSPFTGISPPIVGGFSNLTSVVFSGVSVNVSGSSGTMIKQGTGGSLVETSVGGSGEPAVDLTQVFAVNDGVIFYDVSGVLTEISEDVYYVASITPTSVTIGGSGFPGNIPNTAMSEISIYPVNNLWGEEGGVSKITMLRDLQLTRRSLTTSTDPRKPIIVNVSVSGKAIAAFSKVASPEIYNRSLGAAAIVASNAAAAGMTWCVVAESFLQGGSDTATLGSVYGEALNALATGQQADLMAVSGQTKRPLFCVAQISGQNLPDFDNNGVAMAQLEFGRNPPNSDCYFYGPMYFVTDLGNYGGSPHWVPNGEVWGGSLEAKIDYKILEAGEGWKALQWINVETRGTKILLTYHVPEFPLQFAPVYVGCTATMFSDYGFTISDAAGTIFTNAIWFPVRGDENQANCLVEIDCSRLFDPATLRIVYANFANHRGSGNLRDSCPWISYATYVYNDFEGQYPFENIPALIGNKFNLYNWACVQNELASQYT